ncbi:MAG TPA: class I SAM-dependent methyltransferase [Gaiellaceae bacterium]|jgi:SAM-dependent methyltransferase|nr:class I SAM-dependent methyltransferase [Gaiellaceae bacterium]
MPAGEPETAASAGVSAPEQVDVAALFERLKEEVRHAPGLDVSDGFNRGLVRTRLRSVAERWWPVTAERPLDRRPGLRGALLYPVKKVLRRLMRFYVEPFAADQRAFNDAALKLVDELFEEVDLAFGRLDRAEHELAQRREDARRVGELEERLTRVERRRDGAAAAPATVAAQPAAAALPDYFAFEARMRGRSDEIRERQRAYVEDFRDAAPVLDVGCGRAELVGLLLEAGVEARGVDADADMVAFAQGEGLPVEQADLLAHLETLEDGSLGGIFAGQVVEHLPPPALVRLLELAAAKLRPGGVLVAETINPLSPLALRYYFADLTHAQPLVPETLELLARQAGFRDTELRYLNAPEERLREVELEDDAAREALAANIRRLNEILFAPLDYALLART